MTTDKPGQTRLELARGYLAEYLADEDIFGGESTSTVEGGYDGAKEVVAVGNTPRV